MCKKCFRLHTMPCPCRRFSLSWFWLQIAFMEWRFKGTDVVKFNSIEIIDERTFPRSTPKRSYGKSQRT